MGYRDCFRIYTCIVGELNCLLLAKILRPSELETKMDRDTFNLQPPNWAKDDLDEATTNDDFGPEIEIELVGVAETMADLDRGSDRWS